MRGTRPRRAYLVGSLVAIAVATLAHAGPAAEPRQPKTHLGGKPDAMVALVEDCSAVPPVPVTCGDQRCLVCLGSSCAPGNPSYPMCCGDQIFNCGVTGSSCTSGAQCGTLTCPSGIGTFPSACSKSCQGGLRARLACQTDTDCPSSPPGPGATCRARPTGAPSGAFYTVPPGAALVVTDVLTGGSIQLASDDQGTKVIVSGTHHFTAGIVFPAGSHVNLTLQPATVLGTQLLGYLVRSP